MIRVDLLEFELEMYRNKALELFEENKNLKARLAVLAGNPLGEKNKEKTKSKRGRKSKDPLAEFKDDVVEVKKVDDEEELLED